MGSSEETKERKRGEERNAKRGAYLVSARQTDTHRRAKRMSGDDVNDYVMGNGCFENFFYHRVL